MSSALARAANLSSPSYGVKGSAGRKSVIVQARLASKAKGKTAAMVCVDCGYLYDSKKGPFDELPGSYACPVCGSPKKRFKGYEGNLKSNDNKTMSNRREQLREQLEARGESVEEDATFLYVTAASAAVFLGAVYYFTVLAR